MIDRSRWLLGCVAASLAITASLGICVAQCPTAGNACTGACESGIRDIRQLLGAIECEHGPEYNTNCGNPPRCCETQPGGCTHAANECSCFGCGNNANCEFDFHVWVCGCGRCATNGFTQPAIGGACPDCKNDPASGPNDILKEERDMDSAAGTSCDPAENFWMTWVYYCGGTQGAVVGNCQAVNDSGCVYSPGSAWVVTNRGIRKTCQPGS